jgi:hypothetical protein
MNGNGVDCYMDVRAYGQTLLNIGGYDVNSQCLACFLHQQPLVPVVNEMTGLTEYQDYVWSRVLPAFLECLTHRWTKVDIVWYDSGSPRNNVRQAITELDWFLENHLICDKRAGQYDFNNVLGYLFTAALYIKHVSQVIGQLSLKGCYGVTCNL